MCRCFEPAPEARNKKVLSRKFSKEEKPMKRSMLGVVVVVTFIAVYTAAAPTLTFTYSNVVASKTAIETDSYAVNDAGVIAGDYVDSAGAQHAMILDGKKLTTVDNKACGAVTGSTGIQFYGINSAGTAAGWCTSAKTEVAIAFTYAKGKFTTIAYPKATATEVNGINDKGDVVGIYLDTAGVQHGFSKVGTKYTSIDVKGDTNPFAWGINNAGQITVYATNSAGDYDSFLMTGKKLKNIDNPNAKGGLGTIVHNIAPNSASDIDGTYFDSAGDERGWLLTGGKYYDVEDPGDANDSRADGLNDKLEIVGRYGAGTYGGTGFKATTKK
jgi:hypothetical protein